MVVPAAVAETADMVDADYDSDNIPPSCEVVGSENVASCAAAAAAAVEHVDNCNSYHNAADDWGFDAAPLLLLPVDESES